MQLLKLVDQLAVERSISDATTYQYQQAVKLFGKFLGHPATVDDLTAANVNGWLQAMEQKYQPLTIRSKRVGLLVVWNYAAEVELANPYNPRRIRKVKVPRRTPKAWGEELVAQVIQEASQVLGTVWAVNVPANKLLPAYVRLNYETGMRQNDLLLLRFKDIDLEQGIVSWTQHKTGQPHRARISPETCEAIRAVQHPEREHIFPTNKDCWRRWKDKLLARIPREHRQGLNTLRKSHASHVAKRWGAEAAASSLGHLSDSSLAKAWYIEPSEDLRLVACPEPTKSEGGTHEA